MALPSSMRLVKILQKRASSLVALSSGRMSWSRSVGLTSAAIRRSAGVSDCGSSPRVHGEIKRIALLARAQSAIHARPRWVVQVQGGSVARCKIAHDAHDLEPRPRLDWRSRFVRILEGFVPNPPADRISAAQDLVHEQIVDDDCVRAFVRVP